MVDQSNGGSIDKSAPVDYTSSINHIKDDLLPFIFCCTPKLCDRYYQNRPPINDVGWNPPIPGEEVHNFLYQSHTVSEIITVGTNVIS